MERLAIAYVTETFPPEVNGVALSSARVVEHLRAAGHRVSLVRPRQAPDGVAPPASDDATLLVRGAPLPRYPGLQFGLARPGRLAARWRATPPDVVHIATEGPLGLAALAVARRLGIAATTDYRTNFQQYAGHYRLGLAAPIVERYLRAFHNAAAATFVPSRRLVAALGARGYRNLEHVGRGVDTALFTPVRRDEALRRAWGLAPDGLAVLHVGRIAAEKNPDVVLRAFAAMRAMRPDARLVWIGDGPLRGAVAQRLPGAVFCGVQHGAALAAHYASGDAVLFPSLTETFGNVTLEAMASGLAVVAFDYAAAGEQLADGTSGVLAPYGDAAAFIARAAALAWDRDAPARLGRAARAAAERLAWPAVAAAFAARLAAHARSGTRPRAAAAVESGARREWR